MYGGGFNYRQKSGLAGAAERSTRQFLLEDSITRQLLRMVRGDDSGLFICVLTAFGFLLHKYSDQAHVVIHSPPLRERTGKPAGQLAMVPLLLDYEKKHTLKETLLRLQQRVRACYAYQHYPARMLQDAPAGGAFTSNILIRYASVHELPDKDPAYQLCLYVMREEDKLSLRVEYVPQAFDSYFIDNFEEHLIQVLKALGNPGIGLGELEYIPPAERALLRRFSEGPVTEVADQTLVDLFEGQVARSPHAVALVYQDERLTYQQLDARANQLAHYLRQQGVAPQALVGLLIERSLEMVIGLLGILKAGAAYLPIDPAYPSARIAYLLEDSRAQLVLTTAATAALVGGKTASVLIEQALDGSISTPPAPVNSPDHLAYVIYTSGSTGQPKGVMIEHKSVVNLLASLAAVTEIGPADTWLAVTMHSFDISVLEILLPLLSGARLIVVNAEVVRDPVALIALLAEASPTLLQATPSLWAVLLDGGWSGDKQLTAISGGEPIPQGLQLRLRERFKSAWNGYGPTEATIYATMHQIKEATPVALIGRPLPNYQAWVLDSSQQPVALGVTGEIYLGGVGLGRGYLNRPDLTAEKFVEHPHAQRLYRTGDLGRWLPDGNLEFVGRRDRQVKIRGHRVELGEVQYWLEQHGAVDQAVVMARETGTENTLVAFLKGSAPLTADMRAYLAALLPGPMIPAYFTWLEEFPLLPNGKIDHLALSQFDLLSLNRPAFQPATDAFEAQLTAIWEKVLGVGPIGIRDNFFEVGGNSLKVAQLLYAVEQTFPGVFKISQLFTYPTIMGQANRIRESAGLLRDEPDDLVLVEF